MRQVNLFYLEILTDTLAPDSNSFIFIQILTNLKKTENCTIDFRKKTCTLFIKWYWKQKLTEKQIGLDNALSDWF